jgi:hypothetical protein
MSTPTLSTLDEKLMLDKNKELKNDILAKLKHHKEIIKPKMDKGELSPTEFEVAQKLFKAIEMSESIINDR